MIILHLYEESFTSDLHRAHISRTTSYGPQYSKKSVDPIYNRYLITPNFHRYYSMSRFYSINVSFSDRGKNTLIFFFFSLKLKKNLRGRIYIHTTAIIAVQNTVAFIILILKKIYSFVLARTPSVSLFYFTSVPMLLINS